MDLLLSGKIMGLGTYDVRMKCLDPKITPQNRIILCRAVKDPLEHQANIAKAHAKLETAYRKAHAVPTSNRKWTDVSSNLPNIAPPMLYLAAGFATGAVTAFAFSRR